MHISSNMSAEETYRLHGYLSCDQIEYLLDCEGAMDAKRNAIAYLDDASPGIGEDFLQDVLDRLNVVFKNTRGANRADLEKIIADLTAIETEVHQAVEHTDEQIRKAVGELE